MFDINWDENEKMLEHNPWLELAVKVTCPALGASIGGSGGAYLGNIVSTVLTEKFMKDKHQNTLKKQEKLITGSESSLLYRTCGGLAIDAIEEVQLWNHGSRLEEIEKILGLKHKIIEWNSSFVTRFNGYENIWRREGEEHTSGNNIENLNTIGISMEEDISSLIREIDLLKRRDTQLENP
ncbi:unnamed protein product [Rhizophagus irregularis]|uniref:Uncharacterized protein n=1 Tax=Rhizophagus irregularis TaxID=588596 RepID=A0A2N1NUL2_9GLOM|nr:hypothetical protein RhiirC2_771285 [Rhizophagus irregularis]CAB4374841.1 unnamed protein product [Rhizophagus irregularis]CAB5374731.1 unnamed protein product [Rhizophagus irregularis]